MKPLHLALLTLAVAVPVQAQQAAPAQAQLAAPAFDFHGLSLGMTRVAFEKAARRPGRPLACSSDSGQGVLRCRAENVRLGGDTTTFSEVDGFFENATGRAIGFMVGRENAPSSNFDDLKRAWDGRFGPSACRQQEGMRQCRWSAGTLNIRLTQGTAEGVSGTIVSFEDREAKERLDRAATASP